MRGRARSAVLAVVLLATAAGCDWTQRYHDFRWSGYNPDRGGRHPGRPGRAATGPTYNLDTDGSPVTGGGRVYVEGTPSVVSSISHLFAVRESDGATLWAVPCHQLGGWQLWAYAEGSVFAHCGTTLHALDAATGAPVWQWPAPGSVRQVS